MNNLRILIYFTLLSVLVSCQGMKDEKQPEKPAAPVSGVPDKKLQLSKTREGVYDQSDPTWKSRKKVDDLLKKLGIDQWAEREKAQQTLLEHILNSPPETIDYLIIRSLQQEDPEISFRSKQVIQQFFFKSVYDPDRKQGFIGLQLMEVGRMIINKKEFEPIRVVTPQDGFPGKAAGIKQGDLILGIDGRICGRNFSMNDFILYIASLKPGTEIELVLFTLGKVSPLKLKLAARPESAQPLEPRKSKEELFNTWFKRKLSEIKEKTQDLELNQ